MPLPPFAQIESKARDLGFFKLGVLSPEDFPLDGTRLEAWLQQGYHADMDWMTRNVDKRLDPALLMPGTQSILCMAMAYLPPGQEAPNPHGLKIARYAQGEDYHRVLKDRLYQLLDWLKTHEPSLKGRPITDSAPAWEKVMAAQAGLGWQGKHSNLITRDGGSWFFLAELLLNQPIPQAPTPQPMANFCGTCRRCIEACPTQAIVADGVVDANRCISYWTIESKAEAIPEGIAQNLNGWVFGCDICQEVCPWNAKHTQTTLLQAFLPQHGLLAPQPADLRALTPETFANRYNNSPLQRTGLDGLQRNLNAIAPT